MKSFQNIPLAFLVLASASLCRSIGRLDHQQNAVLHARDISDPTSKLAPGSQKHTGAPPERILDPKNDSTDVKLKPNGIKKSVSKGGNNEKKEDKKEDQVKNVSPPVIGSPPNKVTSPTDVKPKNGNEKPSSKGGKNDKKEEPKKKVGEIPPVTSTPSEKNLKPTDVKPKPSGTDKSTSKGGNNDNQEDPVKKLEERINKIKTELKNLKNKLAKAEAKLKALKNENGEGSKNDGTKGDKSPTSSTVTTDKNRPSSSSFVKPDQAKTKPTSTPPVNPGDQTKIKTNSTSSQNTRSSSPSVTPKNTRSGSPSVTPKNTGSGSPLEKSPKNTVSVSPLEKFPKNTGEGSPKNTGSGFVSSPVTPKNTGSGSGSSLVTPKKTGSGSVPPPDSVIPKSTVTLSGSGSVTPPVSPKNTGSGSGSVSSVPPR